MVENWGCGWVHAGFSDSISNWGQVEGSDSMWLMSICIGKKQWYIMEQTQVIQFYMYVYVYLRYSNMVMENPPFIASILIGNSQLAMLDDTENRRSSG